MGWDLQEVFARADELATLAQRVQTEDPSRDLDKDVVLALRPDIYFNAGPYYEGAPDRIGMMAASGDVIPGNEPLMFVPHVTSSWDASKRFMLPNWTIDGFHEWFGKGCSITLTEGELGPSGEWYHTAAHIQIEQQGNRDSAVLLAAILLSYAESMKAGKVIYEPRMRAPERREPAAETHGDHS